MKTLLEVAPTPEQLALFSRIKPGVELIRGAAGSGKTTTALLKLKAAVGFYVNRMNRSATRRQIKVLVLTFNRTLRGYIAELAGSQFTGGNAISLEVHTFSAWAKNLLNVNAIIDQCTVKAHLENFAVRSGMNPAFSAEEASYVMGRFLPDDYADYINCRRVGRGAVPRMERAAREAILNNVVIPYCEYKANAGLVDWNDLAVGLAIAQYEQYDVVVIDEAQDFSANEIRAVTGQLRDDHTISIVLDAAQRIYPRSGFTWSEVGLHVRAENSFKLLVNYRNTKQIAAFAHGILDGIDPGDDGALPDLNSATRNGDKPVIVRGGFRGQASWSINYIRNRVDLSKESVAFLHAAGGGWFDELRVMLQSAGLEYAEISRRAEWPEGDENIALSTMHSAKGLEFDYVFIIGVSNQNMPLDDADVDEDAHQRARRLLAMAVGRARTRLVIGYKPSEASAISNFFKPNLCEVVDV